MKKKRKWIILVVVLLALLALGMLLRPSAQNAGNEIAAQTGSLATYYTFEGNVVAPSQQTISAQGEDTVREVFVKQNDTVKKGDRLLRLAGGETIKADMDGEITGLFVRGDDVVSSGQDLAQIVNMNNLEIRIDVDEYDVEAVQIGKETQVLIEALDKTVTATVKDINKIANTSGDLSYYTATLQFEMEAGILPGMRVSAKMLNQQAENVTILKMSALRFDEYNQPYVLVRDGSKSKQVAVDVGINDGIHVEIRSGLRSGESVLDGEKTGMMFMTMRDAAR